MARYSDSASSEEAVLVETDDFALVYDRQNRAFRKKRWNSSTKSWSDGWRAPYSAIVCKDASTVWAEDSEGKTIAQGEAGVDDASVIQSAIDSLPTTGGKIFIKKENYLLNSTINIVKDSVLICGEGKATQLTANAVMSAIIKISAVDKESSLEWFYLKNVKLDGSGKAKHGVYLCGWTSPTYPVELSTIDSVYIQRG